MELIECIKRIPSLLDDVIANNEKLSDDVAKYLCGKEIEEVVFIASGTSLNSAKVTYHFAFNKLNLKTKFIYPNVFVNYETYKNPKAFYVFISQGGSTKLVYDALRIVKNEGLMNASITENLTSPIAEASDLAIEMGSKGEEFMYRTIGYSTTVTTCYLLELVISKYLGNVDETEYCNYLSDLSKVSGNLDNIRELTEGWYKNNKFSLLRRNECILTGAGYLYETANEADIKLMEMVPMLTRSFELEEFIHGPQNAFNDGMIFFVLSDAEFDSHKVHAIKSFIDNEIGFCCIVGDDTVNERDLHINYASENFRALEIIICFQVISYHMSTDRGRDLSRGVNAVISKYIKKTL